jgi:hypothetical protein
MSVLRRRSLRFGSDLVRRCCLVIVKMPVRRTAAVPVQVGVAHQYCRASAKGSVKGGMREVGVMAVTSVMPMLGKRGRVRVRVSAMIDNNRDGEPVGFWNRVQRFPESASMSHCERLPRAAFPHGLHAHEVGLRPGQTKAGRNAVLENGQFERAMIGLDALQFRTMYTARLRRVAVADVPEIVAVAVTKAMAVSVAVPMSAAFAQLAQGGNHDPEAERDQRCACNRIDHLPELGGEGNAGNPNHNADRQCRMRAIGTQWSGTIVCRTPTPATAATSRRASEFIGHGPLKIFGDLFEFVDWRVVRARCGFDR